MFYSQCLLSGKGPLGAIWVAAYFFKKLKKAQVTGTDISSSVDKILQDALHIITYRALGYLLLGVVRIYSKKVEYLFDDCHKTLIGINDFVVSTKDNADTETMHAPYFSITLPDRFELDAFDLDILEDTGGGNVVPHEAITLKDGVSENLAIRQYSLDMYHCEEIVAAQSTSSANYNLVEDILSSCLMDINMELGTSYNINSSEASIKRLQDNRFSEEECANFEMFYGIEEPLNTVFPNTEGQANGEMIKYSEISPSEDGMQGEASIEKLRDCSLYQEMIEGEPPDHIKPYSEYHKTDQERTIVSQFVTLDNEMFQVVRGDHNQCSLHTEAEKLEDFTHTPEEYIDHNQCRLQTEAEKLEDFTHTPEEYICHAMFCSPKEPQGLVTPFGEENHDDDGQQISLEITSSANRKCQISMEDHLLSTTPHGILECKVPNTSGSIVPQFMVLPTPAIKERARISRKRKCIIDDMIVLPNEVIRKGIHDASDLVSKRRKVPHTALVAWKSYRIGNLSNCFLEPLVPYVSLELRSLFCQQKLKIIESVKTVGPPAELYVAASPVASRSEQIAIAPETPVQRSTLTKSFGSPGSPEALNYDGVRPEPFETVEKEQPLCRDQQLNFNLCEEIDPCLGDNQKLNGWSGRTRMVARYLDGSFLNQKKQREKEGVNLLPIVVGRTKKESARLFYEILVLKTRGYVDVKQDDAYGDVLIWKLPKWDQISEDDGQ